MSMWNAITVLIGLFVAANLVLTLALVRRVREHDVRLAAGPQTEPIIDIGQRVDDFTAISTEGHEIVRSSLPSGALVGFFDPLCDTCHEHVAPFTAQARLAPYALAVIRDEHEAAGMAAQLAAAATVVVERRRGPVARAFQLQATPAFCYLGDDQTVTAHGYEGAPTANGVVRDK